MSNEEETHDISQPILIVVRKGRGGRGFLVSAVDDLNAISPCQDQSEMAEAIVEMLEDEKQPRVDLTKLQEATSPESKSKAVERTESDDDEDDDDEDGDVDGEDTDDMDEVDLLHEIGAAIFKRAKKASRPSSGRGRRRGRKRAR